MKNAGSSVFAIYDRPRDYPDHVIVRGWSFTAEGKLLPQQETHAFQVTALGVRGAVSAARGFCRRLGLTFVPRSWNDDPVLMETWNTPR